jgi:hypothetical protein
MRFMKGIVVLGIIFVAIALWRGWFTFSSYNNNPESGEVGVNLAVDRDKLKDDAESVKEKAESLGHSAKTRVESIGN